MARIVLDVADAIARELNLKSFSMTFDAVRCYYPLIDIKKMSDLRVWVVPAESSIAMDTRDSDYRDHLIHVAVQCGRCPFDDTKKLDSLVDMTDEIATYLNRMLVLQSPKTVVIESTLDKAGLWVYDHLLKFQVFTSLINVTARSWTRAN